MKAALMKMVLLGLFLSMTLLSQTSSPDDQAYDAIQQVYPHGGFVQKVRLPESGVWIYEVGRIDLFGRRLVLGQGVTWQAAFDELKKAILQGVWSPFAPGTPPLDAPGGK